MAIAKWIKGLRGKLLMLVAFPMVIMGIISWAAISGLNSQNTDIELFSKERLPITRHVWSLQVSLNQTYRFAWLAYARDTDAEGRKKALDQMKERMKSFDDELDVVRKSNLLPKTRKLLDDTDPVWTQVTDVLNKSTELLLKNNPADNFAAKQLMLSSLLKYGNIVVDNLMQVVDITEQRNVEIAAAADERSQKVKTLLVSVALISSGLLLFFGLLIAARLASILGAITMRIGDSGRQVSAGSVQLSSASQQLSSGATEAAASLEETVSSIEELSSMVKLNADHAREAAALSETSKKSAEEGEAEIKSLIEAMSNISQSSKKIEEIINVIDDIAFQTNLLALNAAVEAARAGEQGKGFAVVAEAVRNLAQRSASAAKDITSLIKDSAQKTERGGKIADQSGAVLKNIVTSVKKVADLNTEISTASQEQANGISQIGKAMNQLDQATQGNASAAEEVAASSEEMSAQASSLQDMVNELIRVVEGDAKSTMPIAEPHAQEHKRSQKATYAQNGAHSGGHIAPVLRHPAATKSKPTDPEKVLPLEDGAHPHGKVGTTDGF